MATVDDETAVVMQVPKGVGPGPSVATVEQVEKMQTNSTGGNGGGSFWDVVLGLGDRYLDYRYGNENQNNNFANPATGQPTPVDHLGPDSSWPAENNGVTFQMDQPWVIGGAALIVGVVLAMAAMK